MQIYNGKGLENVYFPYYSMENTNIRILYRYNELIVTCIYNADCVMYCCEDNETKYFFNTLGIIKDDFIFGFYSEPTKRFMRNKYGYFIIDIIMKVVIRHYKFIKNKIGCKT